MNSYDIYLLINATASLLAVIAQLVAAWRRSP
jgi:hypothetical protein